MKIGGLGSAMRQGSPRVHLVFITPNPFLSGVLSHRAVREKIVRAFLIEEQKIVNKVLKAQGKLSKE